MPMPTDRRLLVAKRLYEVFVLAFAARPAAGHAPTGATADAKLTFGPDRSAGGADGQREKLVNNDAGLSRPSSKCRIRGSGTRTEC